MSTLPDINIAIPALFWLILNDTGIPHFTALPFIALDRYCGFYKLKICGNTALSISIDAIFLTGFAHFVSLCHILVILAIYKFFIIVIFVMVICDQWPLMLLL